MINIVKDFFCVKVSVMRKFNSKDVVVLTGDETGTLKYIIIKYREILACRIN